MKNSNVYALLISAGDYKTIGFKNLPTYKGDPVLLGASLTLGLNVPQDHIRIISGDERPGFVRTATFARAIGEMKSQLGSDDTFILYFSGHGKTERAANVYTPVFLGLLPEIRRNNSSRGSLFWRLRGYDPCNRSRSVVRSLRR